MSVAFVDTETIGLDPERHGIWEVGLIVDGNEYEWQLPVDLGLADARALEISRFYERRADATDPFEFAAHFARLTRGCHLVGAVISFDEERLRKLLRANGACPAWHYHLVDVEALAAGRLGQPPPWDSDELSRAIGVDPESFDRHTALSDARWAKALYDRLVGQEPTA